MKKSARAATAATTLLMVGLGGAVAAPAAEANTSHGLRYCSTRNIQVHSGSRGDCVVAVQRFLRMKMREQWGPHCELETPRGSKFFGDADPGPQDGIAGSRTVAAIKCFQADANRWPSPGLKIDGWVGPATYRAMLKWCSRPKAAYYYRGKWYPEASDWSCKR